MYNTPWKLLLHYQDNRYSQFFFACIYMELHNATKMHTYNFLDSLYKKIIKAL